MNRDDDFSPLDCPGLQYDYRVASRWILQHLHASTVAARYGANPDSGATLVLHDECVHTQLLPGAYVHFF